MVSATSSPAPPLLRIGCYSGFWGDSVHAARQIVDAVPRVDVIVADYLAEVTMGLLARRSRTNKDVSKRKPGYIDEIIPLVLQDLLPKLVEHKTKLVCNAGGLDPVGLKEAIEKFVVAKFPALAGQVKVAAVYGDDLLSRYGELKAVPGGITGYSPFGDTTGARVEPSEGGEFLSINAYVGAEGIARALDAGATIVVTGRCVDSALVLGPCLHAFGWDINKDLDLVAAASLAGHVIECGAQATGGNFTDWRDAAFSANGGWANMGYGIVEVASNGEFIVTKPANTGGVCSVLSVSEQMLYEVLDPANYLLPDVILDLTNVKVEQVGIERVKVSGARGRAPPTTLKCTAISSAGFTLTASLGIVGGEAREKGLILGEALLQRASGILERQKIPPFTETRVEVIGSEHSFGKHALHSDSREVIMRVSATHPNPKALGLLAMELAYSATSTSPAITGGGGGRASPSPRFDGTSFLIEKSLVPVLFVVGSSPPVTFYHQTSHCRSFIAPRPDLALRSILPNGLTETVPLIKICVGRSGDKGNNANIALIARSAAVYPLLLAQVTPETIREALGDLIEAGGDVQRYVVPGSLAINFVVSNCLGGGGLRSVRFDKQAKSYAQICLNVIKIQVPLVLHAKL